MAMRVMAGRADNRRAAELFYDLALAMEIQGERWRANSYLKAARSIEVQNESLRSLSERKELRNIEGVGESIEAKLEEYLSTGRIEALDEVRDLLPEDLPLFRDSPVLGLRRVADLGQLLGIRTIDELLRAIYEDRLADLPDFDQEVQQKTMDWLVWKREEAAEVPTPLAQRSAHNIMAFLRSGGHVSRIELSGPARRAAPTVANITILFSSPSPDLVVAQFGICPEVSELTMVEREQAVGKTSSGAACLVRSVEENLFAWELLRTTGSGGHLRDLSEAAREAGKKLSAATTRNMGSEEDIYAYIGVPWVSPEMREGRDGRKNATMEPQDLLGDLHVRSTSFDGGLRVMEMVRVAQLLGHRYICFCDRVGERQMDADLLDRRNSHIDEVQGIVDITLLKGAEVDITVDGRLGAPPDLLESLDLVIGSVNTRLAMPPEDMEVRVLRALDDPNLDVLGHPTNRVVGLREGSGYDLARIAERAAERKVALEINAYPDRLDLADNDAYKVYDAGAFYSLGTDAAYPNEMYNWKWAVTMARKALLSKDRVLNSRLAEQLKGRAWRK